VVPGQLSARHTAVQCIPTTVTAGVPAEFAVLPADQFGNRGAAGVCSYNACYWFAAAIPVARRVLHTLRQAASSAASGGREQLATT